MKVREIMVPDAETVHPDQSIREIAQKMAHQGIGYFPVTAWPTGRDRHRSRHHLPRRRRWARPRRHQAAPDHVEGRRLLLRP
jgi:hypothetical protein